MISIPLPLSLFSAGLLAMTAASSHAALTAYYTLDNLTTGIQNLGTDGATSDLSAANAGATPTLVAGGIVGGALSFDGNDLLSSITAGNAGDDLTGYPFSMSVWMRNAATDIARDAVFSVSDRAAGDRYYLTGVQGVAGNAEPELVRRNTTFTELDATGADAKGAAWTNVTTLFGTTTAEIFVNGKLRGSAAISQTFNPTVNTIAVGGFLRNSGTTPTDPFTGQTDDLGLFDTLLATSDIALINGLGQTGSIGLDQLDEAQALNALGIGSQAVVGGVLWRKVTLPGVTGDFGGTVAAGSAFIVTGTGTGIAVVVPEPGKALLVSLGLSAFLIRRRRPTARKVS